jgi:hypothetical protein
MEKVLFLEVEEESKKIINKIVSEFLKDKVFNLKDNDFFINHINEKILKELLKLSKYFKYMIQIVLFRPNGGELCQYISTFSDPETDGVLSEEYRFEKISCIVNVFFISL